MVGILYNLFIFSFRNALRIHGCVISNFYRYVPYTIYTPYIVNLYVEHNFPLSKYDKMTGI